ncbi:MULTISPECIES: hypothetical protein [Legionella]|uniref:Uncharacterized protein n=1 Tax=Legionella drozanskii LLAP-1 TaxID=1212489 RepID=A0A0W0T0T9_9GAMM|nr:MULTISPECIES: hypothetical protein [Legionella]KTC89230.1 hypothetical protein Ldro_0719 [Legionella drozanskii LLAP-1]PJE13381.1 MAG: hypothetical protein CK430_06390 [Legionella sp.]
MKKWKILCAATCLFFSTFCLSETINNTDIRQLVNFIVSNKMLIATPERKLVPLSFFLGTQEDIDAYFGDFICTANNSCTVVNTLFTPFAILGRGLPPLEGTELEWLQAQAQIERTTVRYATDIYHGATRQIALALAAKNGFLAPERAKILILNELLYIMNPINRATGLAFLYGNKTPIFNPNFAFSFQRLAINFFNKDPFFNGRFQDFIRRDFNLLDASIAEQGHHFPAFFNFITTWSDFRPLTGKNAWAQLIGPLQAEFILDNGRIPLNSLALQNAINSLIPFGFMQTGIGAFYFAPLGTQGIQVPLQLGEISIEDNFEVLAGLQILKAILQKTIQTVEVRQAIASINIMLYGGRTINGFRTLGLLNFLYNGSFDVENGLFITGGIALTPSATDDWQPGRSFRASFTAVSTNLWAISALGVETIDNWFGRGTALKIWQTVRNNGGFFNNGELWGLGFSLNNNVGAKPESIMAAAQTAAAVNALNSLIDFYRNSDIDVRDLEEDLASLQLNFSHLRNDRYLDSNFVDATPREFFITVPPVIGQAFLHASKRFSIPFDWNANTIASINANAWVIMNNFNFNPFQYGGRPEGENYPIPQKVDILDKTVQTITDALPMDVTVNFSAGELGPIRRLVLRYNLDGSQTNWIVAANIDQRDGFTTLPRGTKAISISTSEDDFNNICHINPATSLCADRDCLTVRSINAHWSADGLGNCDLGD